MKPAHHSVAIAVAILLGNPVSAEPNFGGYVTWHPDDFSYTSSASWKASCNGSTYVVSLERLESGENIYSVTKDGKQISKEVDEFLSRNTSYFREFNWLESISCRKDINNNDPDEAYDYTVIINFMGISRLPQGPRSSPSEIKYNAYKYNVIIENSHISSQTRHNLSEKIVSDLPQYLDEQGYEEAVPGTALSPYYCHEGPPCPEFTGENGEKAD